MAEEIDIIIEIAETLPEQQKYQKEVKLIGNEQHLLMQASLMNARAMKFVTAGKLSLIQETETRYRLKIKKA